MKTCHIVEHGIPCDKPAKARGLCAKHYQRWQKYGDPLTLKTNIKWIEPGTIFTRVGGRRASQAPLERRCCSLARNL
jgi:hypothetical protein